MVCLGEPPRPEKRIFSRNAKISQEKIGLACILEVNSVK